MVTQVLGGMHSGASFLPTNGVSARSMVETQIVAMRERGISNPRGRLLDEKQQRHNKKLRKR